MNRDLSLSQRIWNCAATQEAEFVHATHTYLHARANATEEWSQIWSRSEDISWAMALAGCGEQNPYGTVPSPCMT